LRAALGFVTAIPVFHPLAAVRVETGVFRAFPAMAFDAAIVGTDPAPICDLQSGFRVSDRASPNYTICNVSRLVQRSRESCSCRETGPALPFAASMEALLVSTGVVALAEIGDKTQLLALLLATRFRAPWHIVLGILVATLLNHALAGALGTWIVQFIGPQPLRWILGISFIAMAAWALIPDSAPDEDSASPRYGVFLTTVIAFFLVEMGDKTQIATVALAAQFHSLLWVVVGTTLGMMLANVPVVFAGDALIKRVPLQRVRIFAALSFVALGLYVLLRDV
jgi:putative Ca2+/H+ antiporter (TMEM165/GDT1 family)